MKRKTSCPASFLWSIKSYFSWIKKAALILFLLGCFFQLLSAMFWLSKISAKVLGIAIVLWVLAYCLEKIWPFKKGIK